jgi:hypothetical protein
MKTQEVYRKEREYLKKHIFFGLENLNDGFDVASIGYFSESQFEVVLDRVKQNGLGIHGIEPWQNGEYYDVRTCPMGTEPTDSNWYFKAFQEFKQRGEKLDYAASYYIPENLLE